ncbi:MAG: hypothetical protein OEY86_11160 [Nitrospira sp.]|nr:hypothetical protein [Nitrospira sp.]
MPADNPLVLTAATNHEVPVLEEETASDTVSQDALSEAVNVFLEFVMETVNVWFGGFSPPATAENVRAVGLAVAIAKDSETRPRLMTMIAARIGQNLSMNELFFRLHR